jgi:hypothetical protein
MNETNGQDVPPGAWIAGGVTMAVTMCAIGIWAYRSCKRRAGYYSLPIRLSKEGINEERLHGRGYEIVEIDIGIRSRSEVESEELSHLKKPFEKIESQVGENNKKFMTKDTQEDVFIDKKEQINFYG